MKHVDLCQLSHHDPPTVTSLAVIQVSFGRHHRHRQIFRHLARICQEHDLWIEHVVRAHKSLVLYVANATNLKLQALDRQRRSDIVVAIAQ